MENFRRLLPESFTQEAKDSLSQPVSEEELHQAVDAMSPSKCLGPDGFIVEFYKKYWPLIGLEFTSMIHQSVLRGSLPNGMNRGTIALLHKGGARDELGNWRSISLLNVAYEILAKALQRRLQPFLADVLSTNQSAFIPTRYTLDNIVLLHESIGIPPSFVHLVRILFQGTEAAVCINGVNTNSFPVLRGVRQGCPLAPYLFLFVGEALGLAAKQLVRDRELSGLTLPAAAADQIISQYADDVNFTIAGI